MIEPTLIDGHQSRHRRVQARQAGRDVEGLVQPAQAERQIHLEVELDRGVEQRRAQLARHRVRPQDAQDVDGGEGVEPRDPEVAQPKGDVDVGVDDAREGSGAKGRLQKQSACATGELPHHRVERHLLQGRRERPEERVRLEVEELHT